jgi:elongation factor G
VYSGHAATGDAILNAGHRQKERFGRLLRMHANHREEVQEVFAGDIAAAIGLKRTFTGDTLADLEQPILLESIPFPEPVISRAIEPKTKDDQDRMGESIQRLVEEDPTFRTLYDRDTGQTIISGMGELHLEVIVDRLLREFRVEANVGQPEVAFKETISRSARAEGRFVKQTGGRGQFAVAEIEIAPRERGAGFEFVDATKGGSIPKEYIPAVEHGVRQALDTGTLGGYPVVDVSATLLDGQDHPVDSSEIAFRNAGNMAMKDALGRADPILLEPIMKLEISTPEEFFSNVVADVNGRRGQILGMELRGNLQIIRAIVPLAQSFGYATAVRSLTQGRATYSMEFDHYEPVPIDVAAKITGGRIRTPAKV